MFVLRTLGLKSLSLTYLLILLLSWPLTTIKASEIEHLNVTDEISTPLGSSLSYFIDSDEVFNEQNIINNLNDINWQRSQETTPNLGLLPSPTWFAVHLSSNKDVTQILEISYPALKEVDVYFYQGNHKIQEINTGSGRHFYNRPVHHRNFIIPFKLQAKKPLILLIRIQTGGALQLPATLWEPSSFLEQDQYAFGMIALFSGIMMAMAIYNLLLFIGVRHTNYLWYVLTVVSVAWAQLAIRGVLFQYFWPTHPEINEISLTTAISFNIISIAFFSDQFLSIRKTSVVTSKIVRFFGWLGLALMFFAFFVPYSVSIKPLIVVGFVSSIIVLLIGCYLWKKGEALARYYVLAWCLFLLGTAVYALTKLGVLPYRPLFEYAMMLGASFQVLLLSLALAYRINFEKRRRIAAQEAALQSQLKANTELELRVKQRTEELEQANQELKHLSQIDGLTKIKNRQSFDQQLFSEWQRSNREVTNISLLMLDVDFFKKVNDTWGHPCGDACLKYIAETCSNVIKRAGDTVARYGGEEFALLLPSTDLDGAAEVAENIRKKIAETPFIWQEEAISITVSIGVASSKPNKDSNHEHMVQVADKALYAAKHSGRNCVMIHKPSTEGKDEIGLYPQATS
ncbi:diguanylate cyclase [Litoribacillus peritrichatus]|uniref:diguanylate cyclase n=1 Tax=Litoribacillus peritrichatus TaxID=718191 RepID=A0ABP7N1K9_9GAMM